MGRLRGKSTGTVLILAGVGLGGYALFSQDDAGRRIATAQIVGRAATTPATREAPAAPPQLNKAASDPEDVAAPETLAPPPSVPAAPVRRFPPGVPPAVQIAEAPPRVPVGEAKTAADPPLAPPALTREIQRELKRIGCYQGDVSGVWSPPVRQAMKTFTTRVNATLPIDRPDPVLLAMVQSQAPGVCSAACPAGQARAADGRCQPQAIVAAGAPPAKAVKPGAAPVAASPRPALAPPAGRMALAGPSPAAADRQARAPAPRYYYGRPVPRTYSAQVRTRERRTVQRQTYGASGYPSWVPFFLP